MISVDQSEVCIDKRDVRLGLRSAVAQDTLVSAHQDTLVSAHQEWVLKSL